VTYRVILQNVSRATDIPSSVLLRRWARHALKNQCADAELTLRIVDETESENLNQTYRHKKGPTNVLSFPTELPIDVRKHFLGDIVICAPLVQIEANSQSKPLNAHWAHLIIHGILHLLGYNHEHDKEAKIMETLEAKLLKELGFDNPYAGTA
jgi:probable rRNA maturation factor